MTFPYPLSRGQLPPPSAWNLDADPELAAFLARFVTAGVAGEALNALRERNIDPATIVLRPAIVSARWQAATTGEQTAQIRTKTLTIWYAIRGSLQGVGGTLPSDFTFYIGSSQTGQQLGAQDDPAGFESIYTAGEFLTPLQPFQQTKNNDFSARLTGTAVAAPSPASISLYGCGLWAPSGAIE
jgi:hypothetical protein